MAKKLVGLTRTSRRRKIASLDSISLPRANGELKSSLEFNLALIGKNEMSSLENTVEKIKSLEEEKKSLLLEIEEFKRISEAKATALENKADALREELNSLRDLRCMIKTIREQLNNSKVVFEK